MSAVLGLGATAALHAQAVRTDAPDTLAREVYMPASPMGVAITARGGVAMAASRGEFPSLIIGESRRGTGPIAQRFGSAAPGARLEVSGMIPVSETVGVTAAFGSQLLSVEFAADSLRLPTRFDAQSLQGALGVEWSVLHERASFAHGGLRSVFVAAGVDVALMSTANRVEGTVYDDSLGANPQTAEGSFTSGEPFRNTVALRGGVGMRFAATPNIEIVAEAWYAHALNALFSSDAIVNNDFTLDVMGVVMGLGYRF